MALFLEKVALNSGRSLIQQLPKEKAAAGVGGSSASFRRVQEGIGRLRVSASTSRYQEQSSFITELSHQAPFRWIPSYYHKFPRVAMGNYGGGLLPGDSYQVQMTVDPHASLAVISQGINRVYTPSSSSSTVIPTSTTQSITVHEHGLFLYAPDPVSLFRQSNYHQQQTILLHPEASLIFIDWFSAGRWENGERWEQNNYSSETILQFTDSTEPVLLDRMNLSSQTLDMDWNKKTGDQFNACASVILYGAQSESVLNKLQQLQRELTRPYTMVVETEDEAATTEDNPMAHDLAGRVLMGLTAIPSRNSSDNRVTVVRLAAVSNEDLYRVLNHCLDEKVYETRIRAVSSAPRPAFLPQSGGNKARIKHSPSLFSSPFQTSNDVWKLLVLADSSLPTGSFAHSSGLEAASQLGLVTTEDCLEVFSRATVQSSLQLLGPALRAAAISMPESDPSYMVINSQIDLLLVTNGPAHRASLDQGRALLRVAQQMGRLRSWKGTETPYHYATVLGALCESPDEATLLFAYCLTRDIVSAAVRMNLIGPLKSIELLGKLSAIHQDGSLDSSMETTFLKSSSCTPVLDAVQPMHDILSVRLFRS